MDSLNGNRTYSDFHGRLPYLRQITGYMGRQLTKERPGDPFYSDHTYSKPWNSNPFTSRSKPARLLFFTYPPRPHPPPDPDCHELIDVEASPKQSCPPPYDIIKARSQMNEWETHLSNLGVEEGQDDWEEQINRTGWTTQQNRIFGRVCKILNADALAKLAYAGSTNEPVMRRIYVDKGSKRLRQVFASFDWNYTLLQWLHALLLENLSVSGLSAYLDMMHTLKAKIPTLVNKVIAVTTTRRTAITGPETPALWNRKPWDPILPSLTYNKLKKLPGSPLLVIVPFAPSQGACNQTKRMKFWLNQLSNMSKIVPVTMYAPGGGRSAIVTQCVEHIIGATRTKINELRENFPNRPIILIGWGVALQEKIAAVVCLGFQMAGIKGFRGDVDDPLLESRVPTLFVVGQNSPVCSEEGITQTAVDRCLLDEISNFLGATLSSLPFQSHSYYPHCGYNVPAPAAKNNKRRKRKLDTILEFNDEGGVEAPAAKWKATSFNKNEYKPISFTSSCDDNKSLLCLDLNLPKTSEPNLEPTPKSGVKTNANAGKRNYVRKSKVVLPVRPESTSSDSSSTSCMSSIKSVGLEKEVDDLLVNPTTSTNNNPLPNSNTSPSKNNSLTFNIGVFSSLGQVRRSQPNQPNQVTPKVGSAFSPKKSPEVKTTSSELNTSTATTSVLHLYKALSGPSGKSNTGPVYPVPARSAFSIPRAGVRPTIGISSLMSYSNTSKMTVGSSSISANPNSELLNKQAGNQALTLEPDQEQVQAIQKLQFHDFPLTTASLTKSSSAVSVTQAKILSSYNSDLKKLQSPTIVSSGISLPTYLTTTTSKLNTNSTASTSEEKLDSKKLAPQNPSTVVNIPASCGAPTTTDNTPESTGSKEVSKRSPVSVIVLTPTKLKQVAVKDKVHCEKPTQDATGVLFSTETKPFLKESSNLSEVSAKIEQEIPVKKFEVEAKPNPQPTEVETVTAIPTTSLGGSSQTDIVTVVNDPVEGSSENPPEKTSPSRGKFKAPSFPTIAATRTRRIRTPKYMYYDL
ncbi:KAT8 regulatory NSL complex subunit 3 [Chamberlinius hualienensis]